ncbi:hypothetical protein D1345_16810 [Chromobacterium rhizoryzae]|uniref:Uncharacterized protein n=1 Tax=Chromobacterium rhizoryzae TaxID=1778675 RepID=A0AAD0RSQ4_9NEIS|nr:hypothetical protein [Chromobacterium rhizoryzae]AXT47736.1 hypothetical protein D1345_16810 [Chromobacterium rhizoryzae]
MLADIVKRYAATLALLAALLGGLGLWLQARVIQQQQAAARERIAAYAQLEAAHRQQAAQLRQQEQDARTQAAAVRQLTERLETLARKHAANADKLEQTLNATPENMAWGDVAVPADIARLLDYAAAGAHGAEQPALRAADTLPPADDGASHQPPTGPGAPTTAAGA